MKKSLSVGILIAIVLVVVVASAKYAHAPSGLHTASTTSPCAVNACPTELTQADSGGTFTYVETSRFSVFLDETTNPQAHLTCTPTGVIGYISNIAPPPQGLYSMRYEGATPGTCVLSDDHFKATIIIVPLSS